ncbi:MAG: VWA domain-containing protein [Firmicutes bacterium]|nr:VWA domain-containing protein [Bacillota bacterium]
MSHKGNKKITGGKIISLLLLLTLLLTLIPAASVSAGPGSSDQIVSQGATRYYDAAGKEVTSGPVLGDNAVVSVGKTVAATSVENEFLVTLDVKTSINVSEIQVSEDAAVILVLDISGSMGGSNTTKTNYMPDLISAAKNFVNTFADANGAARYVSLVTFSSNAQIVLGWTDVSSPAGKTSMVNKINALASTGSTSLESGLQLARNLLRKDTFPNGLDGLPIQNRSVIVFSDGAANTDTASASASVAGNTTGTTVSGSGLQNEDNNPTTNARCASMATVIKSADTFSGYAKYKANIFTVAFGSEAPVTWLGQNIATNSSFAYAAADLAGLNAFFAAVNQQINRWAEAWITTDPMGQYIDFITVIPPNDLNSGLLNFENNTFYWDLKKASPQSFINNIYTYQYTYRIRLNTAAAGFVPDLPYPTNGTTELTYVMVKDGLIVTDVMIATYNVPKVSGFTRGSLIFFKVGADGAPLAGCVFQAQNNSVPLATYTATSQATTGLVILNLPSGYNYTLKETSMPSAYNGLYKMSPRQYTVTVSQGEVSVVDDKKTDMGNGFSFVNPFETKAVSGYVEPMVVETPDPALVNFTEKYDVTVELRTSYLTPAPAALTTTAVWTGTNYVGEFTIENVVPGNYLLYIKRPGYLARCLPVTVSKTDPDTVKLSPPGADVFELWWGDANGDGIVNAMDIMRVKEKLNTDAFGADFDPACDMNGDGMADGRDLMMVLQNINTTILDYPGAENVNPDE